jgi:hypothetical protein
LPVSVVLSSVSEANQTERTWKSHVLSGKTSFDKSVNQLCALSCFSTPIYTLEDNEGTSGHDRFEAGSINNVSVQHVQVSVSHDVQ